MSKTWGVFLAAQDMVLSHRAKFQLIINFFRVSMYFDVLSTGLFLPPLYFRNPVKSKTFLNACIFGLRLNDLTEGG